MEDLRSIQKLHINYEDPVLNITASSHFTVGDVVWYNSTAVEFKSVIPGEGLRVWNGESYFYRPGEPQIEVCHSDVTCSSFRVNATKSAALLEKAMTALTDNGFEEPLIDLDDSPVNLTSRPIDPDALSELTGASPGRARDLANANGWQSQVGENALFWRALPAYYDVSALEREVQSWRDCSIGQCHPGEDEKMFELNLNSGWRRIAKMPVPCFQVNPNRCIWSPGGHIIVYARPRLKLYTSGRWPILPPTVNDANARNGAGICDSRASSPCSSGWSLIEAGGSWRGNDCHSGYQYAMTGKWDVFIGFQPIHLDGTCHTYRSTRKSYTNLEFCSYPFRSSTPVNPTFPWTPTPLTPNLGPGHDCEMIHGVIPIRQCGRYGGPSEYALYFKTKYEAVDNPTSRHSKISSVIGLKAHPSGVKQKYLFSMTFSIYDYFGYNPSPLNGGPGWAVDDWIFGGPDIWFQDGVTAREWIPKAK